MRSIQNVLKKSIGLNDVVIFIFKIHKNNK